MQFDEGKQLRADWPKGMICEHFEVTKEYYLGGDTGDKICTKCGKTFFNDKELDEARLEATKRKNTL